MKRDLQEKVFVEQIERRIDQLTTEFNLSYHFIVGALELILHEIKDEYLHQEEDAP